MYKNQKVNKSTKSRVPFVIGGIVLIIVLSGGYIFAAHHYHQWPFKPTASVNPKPVNTINYGPSSPKDNNQNETRKDSGAPSATLNNGSTSTNGTSVSQPSFSVQIVSANANNGNVHIGTLVNGITSGDCTLTASQAGQQSVVRTSSVTLDVNSYDCGVFNIPTSAFPSSGTWKLTLSVTSGGMTATNSKNVTL